MFRSIPRSARSTRNSAPGRRRISQSKTNAHEHPPPPPRPRPRPPLPPTDEQAALRGRFERFIDRTPRFLRRGLDGLRRAPVSHATAFFILHEITAIIPLFGLASAFHYWQWLPPYFAEGAWVVDGVERFGRYFRKKGWISANDEEEVEEQTKDGQATRFEKKDGVTKWFGRGESATRWVVELASAYAIVKVLLPVRIFLSVWGAPWFARLAVIPVGNAARSLFRGKKS
ncbi:hypothetical protein PV08_02437 [Exophiala spinifera]|uniref:Uncharacterized protein n=1 Tax=Exophiala spinifera TaxID=91928 RepID=A0A0D2C3F2_9EURO|nr:uncharacterized protein PV08_02437 [Exophiala spinifera]KIW18149.1 hypothetical protein PV08_02437 [Exophiala spinifera]